MNELEIEHEMPPVAPSVIDIERKAGFRHGAVAQAATDALAEEIAARIGAMQSQASEHTEPVVEHPGYEYSEEADEDGRGHDVGGSGGSSGGGATMPPSPADQGSLAREDVPDGETAAEVDAEPQAPATAEPVAAALAARAPVAPAPPASVPEAASESVAEPEPADEPVVETVTVQRRIRVRAGEPMRDVVVDRKAGFKYLDGATRQVKAFPEELITALQDELAQITGDKFAAMLPLPSLLTAFVAAQMGVVINDDQGESVDPNTRIALEAFRRLDARTAAVEDKLAALDERTGELLDAMRAQAKRLSRVEQQEAVLETGVTFLVTERIEPSGMAEVPLTHAILTGGKYEQMRSRIREVTAEERRVEQITKGRPIR